MSASVPARHHFRNGERSMPCRRACKPCADLFTECGPDLFPLYMRKLPKPGWPGRVSAVEKRYIQTHRSDAARNQAEQRAERMRKVRLLALKVNTADADASEAASDTTYPATGTGGAL